MTVEEMLRKRQIDFEALHHAPTFGASRMAHELHVPGHQVAKTVLLRIGLRHAIAVLPADRHLDLDKIRLQLNVDRVEFASEEEMEWVLPGCEVGAVPPFGSMFRMNTLVDRSLSEEDEIVFETESHRDAVRMHYRDFDSIEHPLTSDFSADERGMPLRRNPEDGLASSTQTTSSGFFEDSSWISIIAFVILAVCLGMLIWFVRTMPTLDTAPGSYPMFW